MFLTLGSVALGITLGVVAFYVTWRLGLGERAAVNKWARDMVRSGEPKGAVMRAVAKYHRQKRRN